MTNKTDYQKNKLYSAEYSLRKSYKIIPNLAQLISTTKTEIVKDTKSRLVVNSNGEFVGIVDNFSDIYIDEILKDNETTEELFDHWNKIVDNRCFTRIYNAKNTNAISIPKAEKLINDIVKKEIYSKAFYKKYFRLQPKINLKRTKGNCFYSYSTRQITLKPWACDIVLLHEIAHQNATGHGKKFATNFLLLVGRFIGHGEQELLLKSFRDKGVEWAGSFAHTEKCLKLEGITDQELLDASKNIKRCSQGTTKHFTIEKYLKGIY